jgi:hypothetical protein
VARAAADTVRTLPAEQRAWFDLRVVDFALRNGRLALADTALRTSRARSPHDLRLAQAEVRLAALNADWERARALLDSLGDKTDIATSALAIDVMLASRDSVAARRWLARVEQLNRESPEPFARGWTLARLQHGVHVPQTRALLEQEIVVRQDVYGWDQLALARLHAGDIRGAQQASDRARALGTRDANLIWHAALIALAADDGQSARTLAGDALAMNPHFHPRDTHAARQLADAR